MFREMRRTKQLLSEEETIRILEQGTSGTLALLGDDDYPYAVPISYVYSEGKLYFHGAKTGHKADAIRGCDKASFCVIAQDEVIPKDYTTDYRSVIAFGRIRIIDDDNQKLAAAQKLAEKYCSEYMDNIKSEIEKIFDNFCMIELAIEHITGKEAVEWARKKNEKN